MDASTCELIIYYNDGLIKKIAGYSGDFPARLKVIESMMYNSYKYASIKSVEDEISFETRVHNLIPPPPPPSKFKVDK